MIIIPAIDILDGQCVRLKRGEFSDKKIYSTDPVAVAKEWERQGAQMLHIVDLDGAKTGVPRNTEVIRKIAQTVRIPIEVGGGIRSGKIAREYLEFARRIVLGTKALEDPLLIKNLVKDFGSERIVVALELKDGKLTVEGWQKTSAKDYKEFAAELKKIGVKNILFTDVQRDGTLTEPNYDIALALAVAGARVISSGGVSSTEAIRKLKDLGVDAAIVGTALYEGTLTLADALKAAGSSQLTKRIIPCLDVTGGKVVKGVSFENLQIVGDPVALGKKYSDEGADELVFLDISASKDERETLYDVVAAVAREVFIPFTVGGGIGSVDQMRKLLQLGADKISINTAAIKNPALITEASRAFGEQCVVVAIDAKKKGDSYKVFLKGGTVETELDAVQWAKEAEKKGAGEILLTSMDKDGTRSGYDIELLRQVSDAVRIPVIASGGAGSMEDMKAACIEGKADAVLVASLLHYGELTIPQVKKYLSEHGIAMRI